MVKHPKFLNYQKEHKDVFATGRDNASDEGNPVFFADLVNAEIEPRRVPMGTSVQEVKEKVVQYACGGLIRMDSEDAAVKYMAAVKQKDNACPHILCHESGKLVTTAGEIGDGPRFTAPATFAELQYGYFDDLPPSRRPEYVTWSIALKELSGVSQLQADMQKAQVCMRSETDLTALLSCMCKWTVTISLSGQVVRCRSSMHLLCRLVLS